MVLRRRSRRRVEVPHGEWPAEQHVLQVPQRGAGVAWSTLLGPMVGKEADASGERRSGGARKSSIWSFRRAFGCVFIGSTISASVSFTGCRGRVC